MAVRGQDNGRANQRRRTQTALVQAAAGLMRDGRIPTVAEAAEAALVSRATAYRYFPTQEALIVEAAVELASPTTEELLGDLASSDDPAARAEAAVVAIKDFNVAHEAQLRTLLKLSLERAVAEEADGDELAATERCGRRVEWVTDALAPARSALDPEAWTRLVSAIAMIAGIEGHVALHDVCQLSTDDAKETLAWAARALVQTALREAEVSA